ncbi:MAG: DUF2007 domain-containing protein [Planctomycetota bacterium]|nr:DUF2007 domain-containing protein [Planctomycetota bacterium]
MSTSDEHDLLLDSVDKTVADMAKGLLEAAGIPCLFHGPDFDVAELGTAAHQSSRGVSVYVPKGAREKAQAVLDKAWGDKAEE